MYGGAAPGGYPGAAMLPGTAPTPPPLASAVNYNDLCFPKTSNYGSMRKSGRCDFLSRSNIKKIDDVIREHELEARKDRMTNIHVNSEYNFA